MCGIAGFTHRKGESPGQRIWDAVATIIHRGPDHQGCFESAYVSLGNARLKILDLAGGNQPIFSSDKNTVIVFNGEIYNHEEIRRELELRGHRFYTHTDTETVLHAFLEWDTESFSRLRGMFAVALWTESEKRLILARDRVGMKPLYICRRGDDILFGSEMKTIFVHPEVERRLNLNALDCYLALNYVPAPLTLVEGVEKLLPGHWLEWRDGKCRTESYWRLPFENPITKTLEQASHELDSLLNESVREHMLSDVPLGLWLSGGIDSSTVLHYAANASSTPIRTFSISFDGRSFNDGDYSKQVAAHYGTRHQQLDFNDGAGVQDAIEEFAYYADDPNADAGALPVWFLSKMTRQDVTVALSGEGADELFGGYLTYRANELANMARKVPQRILGMAAAAARRVLPASDDKISFEYKVKRFLEGSGMSAERAHVFWNGTFSDAGKRQLTRDPWVSGSSPVDFRSIMSELRDAGNDLKSFLWFDQKYFLPDDILAKVDRISMAHSLEVRPPFLDHRIIEFAATLPADLKMRGSRQKIVLRHLMKDKLPGEILTRKKVGFDIPAHEWLRGPLRAFMLAVLEEGLEHYSDVFQRAAIERCINHHLARVQNLGYHLWGLMILFLWMRRWNIQSAQAAVSSDFAIAD
jgi:asparagine synthase (glutamine-hydrolysing)